ncbi:MAG TPA: hypothetical protein VK654_08720 [Nitrospirota bacterium]|nr:hypothetical protein [Nitrospirota bacterium]
MLSIKVEGNEHLLKVYFDLGMVIGLSLGTLKNEDCFNFLAKCKPLEASFFKGYKIPETIAGSKENINSRLDSFLEPSSTGAGTNSSGTERMINAAAVQKLEAAFIDLIGPLGKMLIKTAFADLDYAPGADMSIGQYGKLIDRLRESLPQEHQASFAAKYAMGFTLK